MDLTNIGHRCAAKDCGLLDFLPFTCGACLSTFCLSHRTYAQHGCNAAARFDVQVFVCPLCKGGVRVGPEGPDASFARHESSGDCARTRAADARSPVCAAARCKKKLGPGMQVTCRDCGKTHCSACTSLAWLCLVCWENPLPPEWPSSRDSRQFLTATRCRMNVD